MLCVMLSSNVSLAMLHNIGQGMRVVINIPVSDTLLNVGNSTY